MEDAMLTKEKLYTTIKEAPNVTEVHWYNVNNKQNFSRVLRFKARKRHYSIEWWCNISYLYFDAYAFLMFDEVKVKTTWPNNFKYNLHFKLASEVIAIVPLEEHGEKEQ